MQVMRNVAIVIVERGMRLCRWRRNNPHLRNVSMGIVCMMFSLNFQGGIRTRDQPFRKEGALST